MPVPCSTTLRIMSPSSRAVSSDTTRSASSGSGSSIVRPSGSTTLATSRGFIRTPPLPIVCATVAICSVRRLEVALADRHAADVDAVGGRRHEPAPPLLTPLGIICASG